MNLFAIPERLGFKVEACHSGRDSRNPRRQERLQASCFRGEEMVLMKLRADQMRTDSAKFVVSQLRVSSGVIFPRNAYISASYVGRSVV